MTAKEFLEEHGIPNMPTKYIPQFQTDVNDTIKALEAYHQAKLKELGKADVVGQSEQLIAFSKWKEEKGYHPIYDHKELVEEYLKSL